MATLVHLVIGMQLLLRVMGYVAGVNASSARQSVNLIPGNWLIIGMSGFIGAILTQIGLRDHDPTALWFVVPLLLVSLLFLVSTLKRDTFFHAEANSGSPSTAPAQSTIFETSFGFTGKLRLHEKEAQRFINVPARAMRMESGALAFVSRIDASTRTYGVVTKSKVGAWLSMPRFESSRIECGTLFYGKKPQAALRLGFIETSNAKNGRVKAILTFDNPAQRDAMRAFLLAQTQGATMAVPVAASPFSTSTG